MPLSALALVLVAALLHATWNLAAKKAGGDHRFAFLSALAVTVLWAPVALAFGVREISQWTLVTWAVVGASALVHVAYFVVLLHGYRVADLTVVYSVARGVGPLLAVLGAALVLREPLSTTGALGAVLVCAGVFAIGGGTALVRALRSPGGLAGGATAGARAAAGAADARVRAGLRWGATTGAFIAAYTVIDGYAVKVLLVAPVVVDYVGNLLRVPMLAPAALRDRRALVQAARAQWRHVLVVATLGPLAYILVLQAVTMAPLSHVAPAREVSMLFAALLGGRLVGEGDRGWRIAGALAIACGVALLAWA